MHCKKKISWIFKILKNRILFEAFFKKIRSLIKLPWGHARSHNKGPDLLAVLTFIGYKQTDRQAKYLYRFLEDFDHDKYDDAYDNSNEIGAKLLSLH